MITQANNSDELLEIFDNLVGNYSLHQACAFLQACWLWPETSDSFEETFEKMVYIYGQSDEVYTLKERDFINKYNQKLLCCEYVINSNLRNVKCRIVSSKLKRNTYSLHDAIAFMKIFDKAFRGFNIFLFTTKDGVYFGCSSSKNSVLGYDCIISPKLVHDINWELIYELLLYRKNSPNFYEYYSGIVGMILSLPECCSTRKKDENYYSCSEYNFDDYCFEDIRDQYLRRMLININSAPDDNNFNMEEFKTDVQSCMNDLNYISSNQVNTMDLFFETQNNLEESDNYVTKDSLNGEQSLCLDKNDAIKLKLLDDPIALIKMMKKERGLS